MSNNNERFLEVSDGLYIPTPKRTYSLEELYPVAIHFPDHNGSGGGDGETYILGDWIINGCQTFHKDYREKVYENYDICEDYRNEIENSIGYTRPDELNKHIDINHYSQCNDSMIKLLMLNGILPFSYNNVIEHCESISSCFNLVGGLLLAYSDDPVALFNSWDNDTRHYAKREHILRYCLPSQINATNYKFFVEHCLEHIQEIIKYVEFMSDEWKILYKKMSPHNRKLYLNKFPEITDVNMANIILDNALTYDDDAEEIFIVLEKCKKFANDISTGVIDKIKTLNYFRIAGVLKYYVDESTIIENLKNNHNNDFNDVRNTIILFSFMKYATPAMIDVLIDKLSNSTNFNDYRKEMYIEMINNMR